MKGAGVIANFSQRLFERTDGAALAVFRFFFGLLMAGEAFYHYYGDIDRWYSPNDFHFTYSFFHWVTPWPDYGMHIHIIVMGIAAMGIGLGLFFRFSCILFTLLYTYLFLIEATTFNNHYYLIILLGMLFSVSGAHSAFSLDRLRRPHDLDDTIPFWNIFLFRAQMVIVYFFGGVAKLNGDWLRGEPVRHWLGDRDDFPLLGHYFHEEWFVYFIAYGGLLFDLGVGFMLLNRKTRLWALPILLFFHGTNKFLFNIGIFPVMAFAITLLFFPGDTPRKWMAWLGAKLPVPKRDDTMPDAHIQKRVLAGVALFLAVQCLMPMRHWLYPGNVSWTEQGHAFAWHMKLRDKSAKAEFRVEDASGNVIATLGKKDQLKDLHARKRSRMLVRPQLTVQYAHFLRDRYAADGVDSPRVYVDLRASLNGRSYQPLIDPDVDLGSAHYSNFAPTPWILPLRDDLPIGLYPE